MCREVLPRSAPFIDLTLEIVLPLDLYKSQALPRVYPADIPQAAPVPAPVPAARPAGSQRLLACLGRVALAAVAAVALLALQPEPAPPTLTGATSFRLPDGRLMAYHVRGRRDGARHTAFWLHGIISSRCSIHVCCQL